METQCQDEETVQEAILLNITDPQILNYDMICRVCGTESDKNLSIFGTDGQSFELSFKINSYLPVKVAADDSLPLSCCWNCTSNILSWHELVMTSLDTDRKLKTIQIEIPKTEEELQEIVKDDQKITLAGNLIDDLQEPTSSNIYQSITTDGDVCEEYLTDNVQENIREDIQNNVKDIQDSIEVKITFEDNTISIPKKNEEHVENEKQQSKRKKTRNVNSKQKVKYSFSCEYCGDLFVHDEEILRHVAEEHSQEIDLTDTQIEQDTGKKEKRKHTKIDQEMVNAAKVVVDDRVHYNCKICGKNLFSPYTYLWHMRIHTGERPYVCELCGKQFRVSQGLARHLRETHQGIKNFGCDICGRMFSTRRNVQEHRRIHTNERPYVCNLCGKAFKQKASLFVHNRSHTDHFPFRCNFCNQGFRTKPPLLVHVTRHTGERPYPCDVCGRCFRIKYELKRHMLVHSDEKPFVCEECGLSFRQKRYLRNHNKTNHNRSTV